MNSGRGNRISAQEQHRGGRHPQSCASNWELLGITGNWHCLSAIPTALKMSLGSGHCCFLEILGSALREFFQPVCILGGGCVVSPLGLGCTLSTGKQGVKHESDNLGTDKLERSHTFIGNFGYSGVDKTPPLLILNEL